MAINGAEAAHDDLAVEEWGLSMRESPTGLEGACAVNYKPGKS